MILRHYLESEELMVVAGACGGGSNAFKAAGFIECQRHSETRPIMRYDID